MTADEAADAAEKKAADIETKNAGDMGSNAAIWAGSGAPPQITAGDAATMAAPRPGFDPSLNPGAPDAVESTHTKNTAAAEAKLVKKDKKLVQKTAPADDGLPPAPAEPSTK